MHLKLSQNVFFIIYFNRMAVEKCPFEENMA